MTGGFNTSQQTINRQIQNPHEVNWYKANYFDGSGQAVHVYPQTTKTEHK